MKPATFTALGGTLGIDFVNTVQSHRGQIVNLLNTPAAVHQWGAFMRKAGRLHTNSWDTLAPGPWPIEQFIRFRRDVRRYLEGGTARDEFLALLAHTVTAAPLTFQAIEDAGRIQLVPIATVPGSPGLLSLLALDWLDLIVKGSADAVVHCQNPSCLAYFLDMRGRRKWCSMDTCGNRQKNARHYARRTKQGPEGPMYDDDDAVEPQH